MTLAATRMDFLDQSTAMDVLQKELQSLRASLSADVTEKGGLQVTVAMLEGQLAALQAAAASEKSLLEADVATLNGRLTHALAAAESATAQVHMCLLILAEDRACHVCIRLHNMWHRLLSLPLTTAQFPL
jgi:hypothetical protein